MAKPSKPGFNKLDLVLRGRSDPVWFIEEVLGKKLWEKQKEICLATTKYRRIAIPSVFGAGKTWVLAHLTLWWLYTHPGSKVITTSPSNRQVRDQIWGELRSAWQTSKFPLGGECLTTDLKLGPTWYATGFATKSDSGGDRFTGYHSPDQFLLFDQSCGIVPQIWDAGEGVVNTEGSVWVAASNTVDDQSEFANICIPGRKTNHGKWHVIPIRAEDTPNVRAGKNIIPGIMAHDFIETAKKMWRIGDPMWKVHVNAEFVEAGAMTVLHPSMINELLNSPEEGGNVVEPDLDNITIGVDIGDEGVDPSVATIAFGGKLAWMEAVYGNKATEVADFVEDVYNRVVELTGKQPVAIYTDALGVGSGPTNILEEKNLPVIGIKASRSSVDGETYLNHRAEVAFALRDLAQARAISLHPLYFTDPELLRKLREDMGIRYGFAQGSNKVRIEDKKLFRNRMKRSPDQWDSVILAFAETGNMPGISGLQGVYPEDRPRSASGQITKLDTSEIAVGIRNMQQAFARGDIDESESFPERTIDY